MPLRQVVEDYLQNPQIHVYDGMCCLKGQSFDSSNTSRRVAIALVTPVARTARGLLYIRIWLH